MRVLALDRTVEVERPQEPPCLLEGSNVLFTCVVEGFPRPEIVFRNQSVLIMPGMGVFNRVESVGNDQV